MSYIPTETGKIKNRENQNHSTEIPKSETFGYSKAFQSVISTSTLREACSKHFRNFLNFKTNFCKFANYFHDFN